MKVVAAAVGIIVIITIMANTVLCLSRFTLFLAQQKEADQACKALTH